MPIRVELLLARARCDSFRTGRAGAFHGKAIEAGWIGAVRNMTISSVDVDQQAEQQRAQRQADTQRLEAVQFGIRILLAGIGFHG